MSNMMVSPQQLSNLVSQLRNNRSRRNKYRNRSKPSITKLVFLRTSLINKLTDNEPLTMSKLYYYLHCFLAVFAIFLSFKCPNGFDLANFLSALVAPHIYLIFILATRGLSFCLN